MRQAPYVLLPASVGECRVSIQWAAALGRSIPSADVNDLLSMSDCAMLWGMGETSLSNSLKPGTTTQSNTLDGPTSTPIDLAFSLDGWVSTLIVFSRIAGYSVYSWAKTKYEWNNSKEVSCGSTIARTPPCSFSSLASRASRLPYQKTRSSSFFVFAIP
jgi:hypothetical protein